MKFFPFLFVPSLLFITKAERDTKIINGTEVDISQFPYMVSLQIYRNHVCGGALLNVRYAITAAHCIAAYKRYPMQIRTGSNYSNNGGQLIDVRNAYIHPMYRGRLDYDASILMLNANVISGNIRITPINVVPPDGSIVTVAGWGRGVKANHLSAVDLKIINRISCQRSFPNIITSRMICAGEYYKDSCQGDSGGPLVQNGTLVGLVSFGSGCANFPKYPGVYTNVADPAIRNFITQITGL